MGYEADSARGVTTHYGARTTEEKYGAQITKKGLYAEVTITFDFDDLPNGDITDLGQPIPANASIVEAKLEVIDAFTSTSTTTDLTVGLDNAAGTAIDADGLIAAAEATQTAIGTKGNLVTGAGALVGFTIGTAAGYVTVAPSVDDLLTGKGRVIVKYLPEGV